MACPAPHPGLPHERTYPTAPMEHTANARLLGCLAGALALVKEAQTLDPDGFGKDLQSLADELSKQVADAEESLAHALNHHVATLLPEGFSYEAE